ncbi:type II secretion system F family protein [Tersicoccus sp. MR15.9]|uniref:type II secretion system F family protein n=1 Tax=Tersicoccus mangrovi TaxID=3121635 RepID=UPI002FE63853
MSTPTIAATRTPEFGYRVRRTDGRVETGKATSATRGALIARLTRNPDYESVLDVRDLSAAAAKVGSKAAPKLKSLVAATRQLALCMEVGMDSLTAIDQVLSQGEVGDRVLTFGLDEVRKEMREQGSTMSAAMRRHPYIFPPLMVETLAAGEKSSTIPSSMRQAADDLEAADEQRARIKKALNYPIVVLVVFSLVFVLLMLVVVPQFTSLFASFPGGMSKMPTITLVVVGISEQMRWITPVVGVLVVLGVLWYRRNMREEKVRAIVDPLLMKLPRVGDLFKLIALSRFCKTLASLSENGVHITEALEITAAAVNNIPLEKAILAARDGKNRGESMVESLGKEPLFPKMLLQFLSVAEETGKIAPSLRASARLYDRDADAMITNIEALLNPIFMIVIGVMVLIVGLAVYLPTFQLGDLISPY